MLRAPFSSFVPKCRSRHHAATTLLSVGCALVLNGCGSTDPGQSFGGVRSEVSNRAGHHVMNQMGHGFPNMIGVQSGKFDAKVRKNLRLPGFMSMGSTGMADMGSMGMKVPENSLPMVGSDGPLDYITMGGMFTIFKVRDELPNGYDADPGWYKHPEGTLAMLAKADDLQRDGIDVSMAKGMAPAMPGMQHAVGEHPMSMPMPMPMASPSAATTLGASKTLYTCVMHPEVVQDHPGNCPKCGMKLVEKK